MAKKKKSIKKVVKAKKKLSASKKNKIRKAKKKVPYVPKGYSNITPYLIVGDAAGAIEFYKKVFGAKEVMRMEQPGGKIGHAELQIGDSKIMLGDECPEMDARSPQVYGGSPVGIHVYVKNVDDVVDRGIAAGARLVRPAENMFYGDRSGSIKDPYGHTWYVSTHIEEVSLATAKKRAAELFGKK